MTIDPLSEYEQREKELTEIVATLADIRARLNHLKRMGNQYSERLRGMLPVGTDHRVFPGIAAVTIEQPEAFDPERAKILLASSPEKLALITRTVEIIDEDLAALHLTGAAFRACFKPKGAPRITFSSPDQPPKGQK